ncbi:MAG: DUF1015 domain-containing protein [Myxococcales bacterium]|nr:DUF1015 domain-containing protein [Myxococcales bacterium]
MATVKPFRGYRPQPDQVKQIASPPYDVLDSEEARVMARGNEISFLHVNKSEIDLPPDTDPYSPLVYETAAANLRRLIDQGHLRRDPRPCFYLYRQKMGDHVQTGVLAAVSVAEYDADLIKKHEHTRKDKEDDRTRHTDICNANVGPVFLTYRADPQIDEIIARCQQSRPDFDFVADDGIGHTLWVVDDPATLAALQQAFIRIPALYVADGHHRSASAARVGRERREKNPRHTGREAYNYFMAVVFPDNQLKILDYNRVVKDLHGLTPAAFLERLREKFAVEPAAAPAPQRLHDIGLYLEGRWYTMTAKPGTYPAADPVKSLDVEILSANVLAPLLGIVDLRTDKRINFVGGIRGTRELERLVDGGKYAAAFAMHPVTVDQLMAIADAGRIMPPKSTWFEPKLRSGIVVRIIEED